MFTSNMSENNEKMTPLHLSVKKPGNTEVLKFLLDQGALINDKDMESNSLLPYAIKNYNNNLENITFLIEKGADMNSKAWNNMNLIW